MTVKEPAASGQRTGGEEAISLENTDSSLNKFRYAELERASTMWGGGKFQCRDGRDLCGYVCIAREAKDTEDLNKVS